MAVVAALRPEEDAPAPTTPRTGITTGTVIGVIVGLLVFLIAIRPALDNDLWFHLRTARWMLDHHGWVGADPFTHTRPGVVRVQTDWLAQLGYYTAWRWTGLAGVAVLAAAVASGAMWVLYRTIAGPAMVRAGVVILTAAASSIFWAARPQMFTFLGTVVVSAMLRRWRVEPDRRWVWWLVPLFAVWANTHGGVVYGVLILGGTTVGEWIDAGLRRGSRLDRPALRRLTAVTAASVAALVLNPSGWRIYGLPFHQVASSVDFVQEVQPPSLGDPTAAPFFLLLGLTAVLMLRRWRRTTAPELLLVVGSALLALQFTRSIPFFAVVAAPVVAARLAELVGERSTDDEPARAPLWIGAGILAVVVLVFTASRIDADRVATQEAAEYPVAATAWLRAEQPPGELFNTFDWGGYLMWELPDYQVSIDGRTDVYDEYLDVYLDTVTAEPGWQDELEREDVATVLLDHDVPLTEALRNEPGWSVVYEDDRAVVFSRT